MSLQAEAMISRSDCTTASRERRRAGLASILSTRLEAPFRT